MPSRRIIWRIHKYNRNQLSEVHLRKLACPSRYHKHLITNPIFKNEYICVSNYLLKIVYSFHITGSALKTISKTCCSKVRTSFLLCFFRICFFLFSERTFMKRQRLSSCNLIGIWWWDSHKRQLYFWFTYLHIFILQKLKVFLAESKVSFP